MTDPGVIGTEGAPLDPAEVAALLVGANQRRDDPEEIRARLDPAWRPAETETRTP